MSRSELEDLINKTQVTQSSTSEEAAKIIASNQTQLATKLADLSDITIISSGWANLKSSHKGRHIAPAVMPDDRHVDQQNIQTRCYNISESGHKLEKKQAEVTITKTFGAQIKCLNGSMLRMETTSSANPTASAWENRPRSQKWNHEITKIRVIMHSEMIITCIS